MLNRSLARLARVAAVVAAVTASVPAQSKILTIADTTARSGDTLLVPVRVSTLTTADSVYAGQLVFTSNASIATVVGAQTAGTLLNGISTAFNATSGNFSFASPGILTGGGVLLYLKVVVPGGPGTTTAVSFVSGSFNEGKPTVSLVNGSVRVLAIHIAPANPSSLVVGDQLQFSYTGDAALPVTWSTPDTLAGTVNASGMYTAKAPGQALVRIRDSRGLRDSSALFAIYPVQAKSLTVVVHDTAYTQTLTFNLPVYLSDVSGLKIISSQLTLTYNASLLQAVDVIRANSKTASWGAPAFNTIAGRVDIALAGTDTLTGTGVLVYVKFRVQPGATGTTTVALSGVLFNENLSANTGNGTFTPLTAPTVVVAPNTAVRTVGDTLRFSVTSGGTPPYQWSTSDATTASIDSHGLMTALKHGTVTVRAVDALGFTGTSGSVLLNDFNVSFPDTSMNLTDTIDVPIAVGNVTSFGIVSFEGRFAYDSTVVRVLSMPTAGTLSSGFSVIYKDTLDTVRVAAAGPSALTGGGILLKVRVRSVASSVGASSPLRFTSFIFNEGLPTATTKNGSVHIGMVTRVRTDPSGVPQGFLLEQNFPNPFNPTTEVRYTVPVVALSLSKGGNGNTFPVSIKVYDLLGREIATLVNEAKLPGTYEVVFDAGGLASGVYLYRMEAGSFVQTKKLVLLR